MTTLTPEQRQAVAEAGDPPVPVADPQTGTDYVLVRADVYRQMQERLEVEEDHREHQAWAKLARKTRDDCMCVAKVIDGILAVSEQLP